MLWPSSSCRGKIEPAFNHRYPSRNCMGSAASKFLLRATAHETLLSLGTNTASQVSKIYTTEQVSAWLFIKKAKPKQVNSVIGCIKMLPKCLQFSHTIGFVTGWYASLQLVSAALFQKAHLAFGSMQLFFHLRTLSIALSWQLLWLFFCGQGLSAMSWLEWTLATTAQGASLQALDLEGEEMAQSENCKGTWKTIIS